MPGGEQQLKKLTTINKKNEKDMKNNKKIFKETPKNLPTKTNKNQHAEGYYQCLCQESQQGLKGNITKITRKCKANSSEVIKQRNQEISKIMKSYQQIGVSLTKLLQH